MPRSRTMYSSSMMSRLLLRAKAASKLASMSQLLPERISDTSLTSKVGNISSKIAIAMVGREQRCKVIEKKEDVKRFCRRETIGGGGMGINSIHPYVHARNGMDDMSLILLSYL